MRFLIYAVDRMLRKRLGMFVFWDDPDCVFRVSIGVAPYPLRVPDGQIPKGARVLVLHFWNEHLPSMPANGPVIRPAVTLRRRVARSAQRLAEAMKHDPRLADVRAVGGVTPLFTPGDNSAAEGIFLRLGFTVTPHENPQGRFMEFWEELYGWLLMWAFTDGNQRRRSLRGLRRGDFWMSAEGFQRRYGGTLNSTGVDGPYPGKATRWWQQV